MSLVYFPDMLAYFPPQYLQCFLSRNSTLICVASPRSWQKFAIRLLQRQPLWSLRWSTKTGVRQQVWRKSSVQVSNLPFIIPNHKITTDIISLNSQHNNMPLAAVEAKETAPIITTNSSKDIFTNMSLHWSRTIHLMLVCSDGRDVYGTWWASLRRRIFHHCHC